MSKKPLFRGVGTALITPTNEKGVDYDALGRLIDWQIDEGVNALIIAGTTGEGSTLSDKEHKELLEFSCKRINKRVPMIAGTGSNDTAYAIQLSRHAEEAGADGLLCVTPYYNKTTQKGLVAMYTAIANSVNIPIILYNVPSRTGVNIDPKTYFELSKVENIVAIKEANADLAKITEAFNLVGDKMDIYSGNDDEILIFLALGGLGVISVLSNIMPRKTVEMCDKFFAGDIEGARKLQLELFPLIRALFSEVNPIPVKAALSKMGFCDNYFRLPLVPMSKEKEEILFKLMKEQNLIY